VVGEYEDGVPLVVVLDGEANRAKAREEEEKARREEQEEAAAAEQKQEQGSDRSQAGERSPDDSGGDDMCESGPQPQPQPEKPAKPGQEEQEWGKTVFLNFFPVSKDDPCTGTPHADVRCSCSRVRRVRVRVCRAATLLTLFCPPPAVQVGGTIGTRTFRCCCGMPFCSPLARGPLPHPTPPFRTDRRGGEVCCCPFVQSSSSLRKGWRAKVEFIVGCCL
jgi:hypothetical protein